MLNLIMLMYFRENVIYFDVENYEFVKLESCLFFCYCFVLFRNFIVCGGC